MDKLNKKIKELQNSHPKTDFLIISRTIDRQLHIDLTNCLDEHKNKHDECFVFLTTYGGDPHGGYRIARCLRHHYKKIKLIVPSYCKSAGTMIAIAADQLAIGDMGELGPLDVQVTKPNEIQERGSGLDIMQALNACLNHAQEVFHQNFMHMRQRLRMSTRQAGELSGQISANLLAPLYSQIEPLRIGELQRATAITLEYGKRLNGHSSNLKPRSLEKLISGYPAHGFVIDRKEAKELFNSVVALNEIEQCLCDTLWDQLGLETQTGPYFLNVKNDGENNVQPTIKQVENKKNYKPIAKRNSSNVDRVATRPGSKRTRPSKTNV